MMIFCQRVDVLDRFPWIVPIPIPLPPPFPEYRPPAYRGVLEVRVGAKPGASAPDYVIVQWCYENSDALQEMAITPDRPLVFDVPHNIRFIEAMGYQDNGTRSTFRVYIKQIR